MPRLIIFDEFQGVKLSALENLNKKSCPNTNNVYRYRYLHKNSGTASRTDAGSFVTESHISPQLNYRYIGSHLIKELLIFRIRTKKHFEHFYDDLPIWLLSSNPDLYWAIKLYYFNLSIYKKNAH